MVTMRYVHVDSTWGHMPFKTQPAHTVRVEDNIQLSLLYMAVLRHGQSFHKTSLLVVECSNVLTLVQSTAFDTRASFHVKLTLWLGRVVGYRTAAPGLFFNIVDGSRSAHMGVVQPAAMVSCGLTTCFA